MVVARGMSMRIAFVLTCAICAASIFSTASHRARRSPAIVDDTLTATRRAHPEKRCVISLSLFHFPFKRDGNISEHVQAYYAMDLSEPSQYLTRYFKPTINTILNWRWLLPDWDVRVYVPAGFPFSNNLRKLGADVVEMIFYPERWCKAMTWRFLVEDDHRVDCWASREAESPPTFQDAAILRHWREKTTYGIHAIHVAPAHMTWNGGLFGAVRGYITASMNGTTMASAIDRFQDAVDATGRMYGSSYNDDQLFMGKIWPLVKPSERGIAYVSRAVQGHRERFAPGYCPFRECLPYHTIDGADGDNDGTFRPSMNSIKEDEAILCHHIPHPVCRRYTFKGDQAWRKLYENCTGLDFYTHEPLLINPGSAACPYTFPTGSIGRV